MCYWQRKQNLAIVVLANTVLFPIGIAVISHVEPQRTLCCVNSGHGPGFKPVQGASGQLIRPSAPGRTEIFHVKRQSGVKWKENSYSCGRKFIFQCRGQRWLWWVISPIWKVRGDCCGSQPSCNALPKVVSFISAVFIHTN